MKKLLVILTLFATLGMSVGKTIYVNANHHANGNGTSWSSPYTNLQTAVTASSAGDLILVTNGVYAPITTGNKAITIQSVEGYTDTIIDGVGTTRCATLGTGVVLDGFTTRNGASTDGGGTYGGSVLNSVIENCTASNRGGGIYTAALVSNCVVRHNTCTTINTAYGGGGVYNSLLVYSTVHGNIATNGTYTKGGGVLGGIVRNCEIYENRSLQGGGVCNAPVYDSNVSSNTAHTSDGGGAFNGALTGCTISGNTAGAYGGGAYNGALTGCTISGNTAGANGGGTVGGTLTGCTISGNTAGINGGGTSGGTLTGCTISGNTAGTSGGGTYLGTLTDCTISGNTANQRGGGTSGGTLTGCTISGNTALINGGGCYNGTIMSCLVVGNIAPIGSQIRNQDSNFYAYNSTIIGECSFPNTTRDIFNNIFYGANITFPITAQVGFNTFSGTLTGGTIVGQNLTATNPQFVDAANTNFTLLPISPCINKGANQYVTTPTDLAGSPRIKDWRVDMGAYESQSTRFVRTPNALYPMGTRDVARPETPWFVFDPDTGTITGFNYEPGREIVVIPTAIDGVAVKNIGTEAFSGETSVVSVASITVGSLGYEAFLGCTSLTNVVFPNVGYLDWFVFRDCSSLTTISLPSATNIWHAAFYNDTSLKSVNIPNVTWLGNYVFRNCAGLASISLPKVESMGESVFYACTNLTSIYSGKSSTLPASGNAVFEGNYNTADVSVYVLPEYYSSWIDPWWQNIDVKTFTEWPSYSP